MTLGLPHTYRSVTRRTDGALRAARSAVRIDPRQDFLEQFEACAARNYDLVDQASEYTDNLSPIVTPTTDPQPTLADYMEG